MTYSGGILNKDSQNVLVIMTDYHLGDFAISMPIINTIANYFDNGIDLAISSVHYPLIDLLPAKEKINPVVYNEKKKKSRGLTQSYRFFKFCYELSQKKYKTVISASYRRKCSTFAFATLAPHRIGINRANRKWFLNDRIPVGEIKHKIDFYSTILQKIGHTGRPEPISPNISESIHTEIKSLLSQDFKDTSKPLVIIHPTAGQSWRCWKMTGFIKVAEELINSKDLNVCIIGSPSEKEMLQKAFGSLTKTRQLTFLNKTMAHTLAILQKASVMIAHASGPNHLAAIMSDIPLVVISPQPIKKHWLPLRDKNIEYIIGQSCSTKCRKHKCRKHHQCANNITPEKILSAVQKLQHQTATAQC